MAMKNVSHWAKRNIRTARFLIVLLEVCLFLLAVRLGLLLLRSGIRMPGIAVVIPLLLAGVSILLYYSETARKQRRSGHYLRRRVSFFVMGLSMFLLTVFFVGSEKMLTWNTYSSLSGRKSVMLIKPAAFPANHLSVKGAKKLDRLLKKMRKYPSLAGLYVALIIIATILIALTIAILSCSISCNGNEVLGTLLFIFGVGGVIVLCVFLVKGILDKSGFPEKMQERLEQQQRRKEQRRRDRKLRREKTVPENAGTANG